VINLLDFGELEEGFQRLGTTWRLIAHAVDPSGGICLFYVVLYHGALGLRGWGSVIDLIDFGGLDIEDFQRLGTTWATWRWIANIVDTLVHISQL
jgi:hypothetical protein